ncbi:nicastrin [Aplysia californica]|uniref:Nicastrin n=1 Tax=Aplysia californica TaxID=6500 RepID=A0ABM1W4S7_APLCA|nr:nicastrin [Aplysia californica]
MASWWSSSTLPVLLTAVVLGLFVHSAHGIRTKKKIYIDLKTQSACFRNFNATHQVGCASAEGGNVGIVYYLHTEDDYQWVLKEGPHAPYIAVVNSDDFNGMNVRKLVGSDRIKGIMVIKADNSTQAPPPFSSVDACPNDRYGLYSNHSEYGDCKKMTWNPAGTGLHFQDLGVPVFVLSDLQDISTIINKCFIPYNQRTATEARSYPLCAAEMKASMDGAVDSVTCMRRSNRFTLSLSRPIKYCDPLGDKNVVTLLKDTRDNETRANSSVIVMATRLDATSLFQNEYRGADTTVAGFVTMLATAQTLWKVKAELKADSNAKDILFTFFQGESFDYIGSSRLVYDMTRGLFPQEVKDRNNVYQSPVELQHIDQMIELNQVALRQAAPKLFAHTDPVSLNDVSPTVESMLTTLRDVAHAVGVDIEESDKKLPLPPASAQRFLRQRSDIPVLVVTDHRDEYTNSYYNSRLDTAESIGAADYPAGYNASQQYDYVTTQASHIASLSTALARYLYNASTGREPSPEILSNLTADESVVTHLLYCFLISPNCELFKQSVDASNQDSLRKAKQPFPLYVSVDSHLNEVTQLTYNLLTKFTGERINVSQGACVLQGADQRFSYTWMEGPLVAGQTNKREGWCVKSLTQYTRADSPAFEIDGYDMLSQEYSTWTESRWQADAISVRVFLMPSQQFQVSTLMVGVTVFILSLCLAYFLQSRSGVLFTQRRSCDSNVYNPML